ncbi:MtnX-like HAD-IB family phosphatase [Chloroflexota bacterium]
MIIQCDFDGTIIRNNLSIVLRERFAPAVWKKTESDYVAGRLTVEQSNMLQFALIKESKEKLQEYVYQHIEVRQGFVEFTNYCRESDIPLVIISSGLDFYIEPVLAEIGMSDLELHCGKTTFKDDGIVVSYFDPQGNVIDEGFKEKYVTWFKKENEDVVYLGDGLSDRVAARQATHVFATGNLQAILNSESIDYYPFTDFFDVLSEVRHLNKVA